MWKPLIAGKSEFPGTTKYKNIQNWSRLLYIYSYLWEIYEKISRSYQIHVTPLRHLNVIPNYPTFIKYSMISFLQ